MSTNNSNRRSKGALARAKDIDLARQPRLAARITLGLSAMIVGLLVLAAKTQVPNVTRAPGAILPHGNYSQVETLEGGVVAAIHVVEGQIVEEGAPLVDLRQPDLLRHATTLRTQVDKTQSRLDNLTALRARLSGPDPASRQMVEDLRAAGFVDAADQLHLHVENRHIKAQAIDRQTDTIKILEDALRFNKDRVQDKEAQLDTARALRDQGLKSLRDYQAQEDQLNDIRQRANDAQVELAQARNELIRMTTERDSARVTLKEDLLKEARTARETLVDLAADLTETDSRLADLSIVAPVSGVVQSVALPNLGEVIEPGETLFELVPQQRGLVIEARIPSNDIGHIDYAQPVSIGVDTFDPRRFGKVEGRLISLSPVPLTDETTGQPYFRAAIGLDSTQIGLGNMERPLRAGMTVVAEIVTGEQTMLAYFLKPIDLTLSNSFRER